MNLQFEAANRECIAVQLSPNNSKLLDADLLQPLAIEYMDKRKHKATKECSNSVTDLTR